MPLTLRVEGAEEMKRRIRATPKIIVNARRSAVNKIASQAMTQTKKVIRETYNVKSKDLTPFLKIQRAKGSQTYAVLEASGRPIPLYKFGARPVMPIEQKGVPVRGRKPVTVKVKRKGARKIVRGAFVARMRSGHVGIFKRIGTSSIPIEEKFSLGIKRMFEIRAIPVIKRLVREKGGAIVKHELEWATQREFQRRGFSE